MELVSALFSRWEGLGWWLMEVCTSLADEWRSCKLLPTAWRPLWVILGPPVGHNPHLEQRCFRSRVAGEHMGGETQPGCVQQGEEDQGSGIPSKWTSERPPFLYVDVFSALNSTVNLKGPWLVSQERCDFRLGLI